VLNGIDLEVAEHEVIDAHRRIGERQVHAPALAINLIEPIDAGRILIEGEEITAKGVDVNRDPPAAWGSSSSPSTVSRT